MNARIGRYELVDRLGEGGMAVVWRAVDGELGRTVAIKLLKGAALDNPVVVQRFVREAQTTAHLSHPNLIPVYDAGVDEGRMYLVMELVDGRALSEILAKSRPPTRTMISILEKVARGLAEAHAKGVVHRDVKPENILVTKQGEPKLGDFGLAHVADSNQALTRTGAALGTPMYMAPEQVAGRVRDITPRTDVYALGAILYLMLTGRPPHTGETVAEIYARITSDDPALPRTLVPTVPPDLQTICMKALEREPLKRYASAKLFAEDLKRWLEGEAILASSPGVTSRVMRKVRRYRMVAIPLAVAAVALVVATGVVVKSRLAASAERERRAKAQPIVQEGMDRLAKIERELTVVEGPGYGIRDKLATVVADARRALEIDPESPPAHLLLGRAHALLGEYEAADAEFGRALAAAPDFAQARVARARLSLERYFLPVSIPKLKYIDFSEIIAGYPKPSDDAMLTRARADFDELRRRGGADADEMLFLEGFALFVRQDFGGARTKLAEVVKRSPADAQAWFLLAQSSFYLNLWKESDEELTQVLKLKPTFVAAMIYRAIVRQSQRRFDAAIADLERVLKFDVAALGQDYPVKREMIQALEHLGRAFANWAQVLNPLIGDAKKKDMLEDARRRLETSIALEPKLYLSHFLLARVLMKQKKWDEALKAADACVKLEPEFANAWEVRAEIRFQLALPQPPEAALRECERDLTEGLKLHPGAATIRVTRATMRVWLKDFDGAADDAMEMLARWKEHRLNDEAHDTLRRAAMETSRPEDLAARIAERERDLEKAKGAWSLRWSQSTLAKRTGDFERSTARALDGFVAEKRPETVQRLREAARDLAKSAGRDAALQAGEGRPDAARSQVTTGVAVADAEGREWRRAEEASTAAIGLDERNAVAWRVRALARAQSGRAKEAREDYRKATELDPSLEAEIKPELDALPK
jgi:tetratricopeptide (TPR) repeat protein/predicted Ser/Thr protein kinase